MATETEIQLASGDTVFTNSEFMSYPGKDFGFFLDHPPEITKIGEVDLDIVIVVLGGNSITALLTNTQLKEHAAAFYAQLKAVVKPDCIKLAMQVEPHFVAAGNRFGVSEASEFNRRRQIINIYLNKNLKRQKLVDRVVMLGSANYLNDPQYFRDGVHLRGIGLERYKEAVLGGLKYALDNKQ